MACACQAADGESRLARVPPTFGTYNRPPTNNPATGAAWPWTPDLGAQQQVPVPYRPHPDATAESDHLAPEEIS